MLEFRERTLEHTVGRYAFYRAIAIGPYVMRFWGKINSKGQAMVAKMSSHRAAVSVVENISDEKHRKGYEYVQAHNCEDEWINNHNSIAINAAKRTGHLLEEDLGGSGSVAPAGMSVPAEAIPDPVERKSRPAEPKAKKESPAWETFDQMFPELMNA